MDRTYFEFQATHTHGSDWLNAGRAEFRNLDGVLTVAITETRWQDVRHGDPMARWKRDDAMGAMARWKRDDAMGAMTRRERDDAMGAMTRWKRDDAMGAMTRRERDDAMGAMARWKRDDAMGAMTRCSTGLALHTRREFLGSAAAAAGLSLAPAPVEGQGGPIPIIDTHIHLFDPTRPQGAPYSGPRVPGQAPIAAYPDRYRTLAVPLGAVGAIKVEASPWVEDNLWVLEVAQRDTIIVGVIGNLEPDKPEFKEYFDRYRKHPLFRGIRYGNLWNRDIGQQVQNPAFIEGLKLLADADLVLDTANPRMTLLQAMVTVNDKVPNLRIVLDHLPNFEPTEAERPEYLAILKEIGQRPQMYVKLSAILRRVDGKVSTDLAAYRAKLDLLVATFGEDRIVFGSDWPNSDGTAPVDQVFRIAKEYFATQPRRVAEKYFWRNSISVYKWIKREPSQPTG